MSAERILEAITVTAELTGTQLSEVAKAAMVEDLLPYGERAVLGSLTRCRREVKGRLTLAEILQRLDDGRPGVEEAWGMYPKDEDATAVVTEEMHLAMRNAWPLLQDGDRVAARMAFKEAYERIVSANRAAGVPVEWKPTLGTSAGGREGPLVEAVQLGRLSAERALALLPVESHERVLAAAGRALPPPNPGNQARIAGAVASVLGK